MKKYRRLAVGVDSLVDVILVKKLILLANSDFHFLYTYEQMHPSSLYYLRIALGAWPPTTYITLGNPIGVLGRVLGDCTDDRCSLLSK